jgi:hypothetical protein
VKGVIDRFEGEYAIVVLDDGKTINLHKSKIPLEAKEGDVLQLGEIIYIDVEETKKRKKENEKYLDLWE